MINPVSAGTQWLVQRVYVSNAINTGVMHCERLSYWQLWGLLCIFTYGSSVRTLDFPASTLPLNIPSPYLYMLFGQSPCVAQGMRAEVIRVCPHTQFPTQFMVWPALMWLLCFCKLYSNAHNCTGNRSSSDDILALRQTLVVSQSKGADELNVHVTRSACLTLAIQMDSEASLNVSRML